MGYRMYAYAHAKDVKSIKILSIADYHRELSIKTPASPGTITTMAAIFNGMKRPAPLIFTWQADKFIHESLFTKLKRGEDFSLDLSIQELDDHGNHKNSFKFDFAQCCL